MKTCVIGINDAHSMYVSFGGSWDDRTVCRSRSELAAALKNAVGHHVLLSSSVDFPEESAKADWIFEVCDELCKEDPCPDCDGEGVVVRGDEEYPCGTCSE